MTLDNKDIKTAVRKGYAKVATGGGSCCGGSGNTAEKISKNVGYTDEDLKTAPEGSNLGLGCGNPTAIASIKEGDTVLDLGSGAGFDAFLATKRVGAKGRVIGVDMTPEMIDRARANALKSGAKNVEFRLGEIENLPVADASIDLIISNCVINLSPQKERVFEEAFRVLKDGGRLLVSDLVLRRLLPASVRASVEAYVGCLAGASLKEDYLESIQKAGFSNVRVVSENEYPVEDMINDPTAKALVQDITITDEDIHNIKHAVVSVRVEATKTQVNEPKKGKCC